MELEDVSETFKVPRLANTHSNNDPIPGGKTCNIYEKYKKIDASGGFYGITQNFIIFFVGFVGFIFIFGFIRRKIWDYGVIAVIKRYTSTDDMIDSKQFFEFYPRKIRRPHDPIHPETYKKSNNNKAPRTWDRPRLRWLIRQREIDKYILEDSTCFGWIRTAMSLDMEDFLHSSGPDCVKYLLFQKHLIVLAFIWTIVSCGVILPLNLQGTKRIPETKTRQFLYTTVSNLKYNPEYLFVHLSCSIIFMLLGIVVLRHMSEYFVFYDNYEDDEYRSVFIQGLNKKRNAHITEKTIREHFEEIYPGAEIREVLLVYHFSELYDYYNYLRTIHQAIMHYEGFGQMYGRIPKIVGCCCGIMCYWKFCPFRMCCGTTDALTFYEEEEVRYKKLLLYEATSRLKSRSLGMAIVCFENVEVAYKCINDYSWSKRFLEKTPKSKHSRKLYSDRWKVSLAPPALDILWQNVTSGVKAWYTRFFFLNFFMLVLTMFYTTPVYVLQAFTTVIDLDEIRSRAKLANATNQTITQVQIQTALSPVTDITKRFIFDTLPALLLLSATVTLPTLVAVSDLLANYWTRSNENWSRMIKTFVFLVIMIVVMPSIGLVTMTKFIAERSLNNFFSTVFNWQCILAPQNGELFVNYMVSAALAGTMSELLRLPELLLFVLYAMCLQSPGEMRSLKLQMQYEFALGSHYAYTLLYFMMFSIFGLFYPLLTPFGLLYFVIKHFVDRYNMYFVYGPCITRKKEIHGLASSIVMFSIFITQLLIAAYCYTQAYYGFFTKLDADPRTNEEFEKVKERLIYYVIISLNLTLVPYILNSHFGFFSNLMPIFYRRIDEPDVFCGPHSPVQKLYYPNWIEVLVDEELAGFYNQDAANRRFAPNIFHDLTFLTSFTGMLNRKILPCHDSSDSDVGSVKSRKPPKILPLPKVKLPKRLQRLPRKWTKRQKRYRIKYPKD